MTAPLLEVRDLTVELPGTARKLVDRATFSVAAGESVGLVGASGAGKSTLGAALMRLLPGNARIADGSVLRFQDTDLLALDAAGLRARRGRAIALIFQEPILALAPAMRVGAQLAEALTVHGLATAAEAHERAVAVLTKVGIGDAAVAATRFPHEFSGGMRQRLLIAMALLPGPALIVADEPTTALDATIQAQVLDLLDRLREETGAALLHISHDLDVIGERCSRVIVLEGGRIVEDGPAAAIVARRRVVGPSARGATPTAAGAPPPVLLEVSDLSVSYPDRRRSGRELRAVRDVSFAIARGESVAIVGESGCGKSSLAHAILRLTESRGGIDFDGTPLIALGAEPFRRLRRRMQWIPQDAGAALTPHLTVRALVAEAAIVHGIARGAGASDVASRVLAEVGLDTGLHDRLPAELSAGERQRVVIARALATGPDLLVCDEPVASVDASTRRRLLDLFARLRQERGLSLLFISHDIEAVRRIADRVLVMYLGRVVESGSVTQVLASPLMPYTRVLLDAVPTGDPARRRQRVLPIGDPPSAFDVPPGCPFHPRCHSPAKDEACRQGRPALTVRAVGHAVACVKA